jgi:Tfp pilus assembly protein PilX
MTRLTQLYIRKSPGFVLISMLLTTMFVLVAGAATAQLTTNNYRASLIEEYRVNAQFAADAGLDKAVEEINNDDTWTGTGGEITLYSPGNFKTTYSTTVTNDTDPLKKFITVTAKTYAPSTSATPRVERTYQVALRAITSGNFSVVTGVGGLVMSNSAKIIGGNVLVNGSITMNNSAQIGLTTEPVTVKAAHQNCPVGGGASYPRVCNSSENGEPIAMNGSSTRIYGDVTATNQTTGTNMLNNGLQPGSVAPAALPTHDRDAQKAAVATTQTGSSASCSSGTRTWAANTKFTGDVSISNTCKVTVQGDIWITGRLTLSNSADLIVANGISTPPVIMIDSQNGLSISNNAELLGNAGNVGFRVITYWSAAGCSPDCSDVTGTDLYNSRNTTTMSLSNGAQGPNTEFYARWSKVSLSNGGNIGSLVGQTVQLSNSAAVTFGTTVSGVGGIEAWVIDSYKRNP